VSAVDALPDIRRPVPSLAKLTEGLGRVATLGGDRRATDVIDLVRLVSYCQGDTTATDRIVELSEEGALVMHESRASTICAYEPVLVPPLLQTRGYAAAVTGEVQARVHRQEMLSTGVECTFFVHEAALRALVGGPEVMAEQARRLAMCGDRPGVSVRLVPFAVGGHPSLRGQFEYLGFTGRDPIVYVDNAVVSVLSERPETIAAYQAVMRDLDELALCPAASRSVFSQWAESYERAAGEDRPDA
jgi:hypothetical protein